MKVLRKAIALVFLAVLMLSMGATAYAETQYQVRVYAGNQGTIVPDGDVRDLNIKAGDNLNFSTSEVTVKDERYYVRGIRKAGLDNALVYAGNASIPVTEDIDYVVAYGMKSSAVRYTVNYVNTDGEALAPSETYYGNVGDKPVIAFVYVDGYLPQAYNLTKTLAADESSNVFTFTYSQVATAVVAGGGAAGAAVVPAAGAGAQQGGAAGQAGAAAQPAAQEPEQIIDLDVPLAGPEAAGTEPGTEPGTGSEPGTEPEAPKDTKLSSWVPYVLGLGGIALLSAFLAALNKRKKTGKALTHEDLEDALKEAKDEVDGKK